MNPNESPVALVSLRGLPQRVGDHSVQADLNYGLPLSTLTPESIVLAQRDFEIIAEKLQQNPGEILKIADALARGKMREGVDVATEIGLTEKDLMAAGGGFAFLVVAVVVGILLVASDAE
jgi:hypothetical protein